MKSLKEAICELSQQLASSEFSGPHPRSPLKQVPISLQPSAQKGTAMGNTLPGSPSEGNLKGKQHSLMGQGASFANQENSQKGVVHSVTDVHSCGAGQGELRLQALRKQLHRSTAQCDSLKAEVAELRRRDRTADLYKKKVQPAWSLHWLLL